MNENPFATPATEDQTPLVDDRDARFCRIGEEVIFWEKLRLLYNAILVVVTLASLLIRPAWLDQPLSLMSVTVFGSIGANLCYSAGTILGAYLAWGGFQNRSVNWLVFVLGTFFSILLAGWMMMMTTFP